MAFNPQAANAPTPVHIPLPTDAVSELIVDVDFDDDKLWVPRGENIESFPLLFSVTQGSWVNITRAQTLDGAWGYIEHDWTATRGTFIYEPPGETHTLIVKPDPNNKDSDHMTVLFHNFGPLMHVDDAGEVTGFVDVFTRIEDCREHYRKVGMPSDYIEKLIR